MFGSSGGFTNQGTEFRIYDDGHFEKYFSKTDSVVALHKLDTKTCEQLFDNYDKLGIDKLTVNAPGNFSSYIRLRTEASEKTHIWGSADFVAPPTLEKYYKLLGQLAKKNKI